MKLRPRPPLGPVDVLAGYGQVAGLDVLHRAGDSKRVEDLRRPRRLQRVNVGSVLHLMGQQFVARTMAGQQQPGLVAQAPLGVRLRRMAGRCGGSIRSSITLPADRRCHFCRRLQAARAVRENGGCSQRSSRRV